MVEAVTRRGSDIVIKLRRPADGARVPLERALGHDVRVGHQQIQLSAGDHDVPWGQALLEVLERLAAFQEQVAAMVEGGPGAAAG